MTISLCMIVKDEEKTLKRCLESVNSLVDEIIVVDTGSTDRTKQIAVECGAKLYDFRWVDDFSAARNFAFSKASMDFILWLDADDILLEKDHLLFAKMKETLTPKIDAVYFKYHTAFDEIGHPTFTYYRERLVKRDRNFRWHEPVHECLHITGTTVYWDVAVTHNKMEETYSTRNMDIYESQINQNIPLSPRGQYYYARELKTHGRNQDAIHYFTLFLEGRQGWIEDCICACLDLSYLYEAENDVENAIKILYQSFLYAIPRGEICCRLGALYYQQNEAEKALYWYQTANDLELPDTVGFIQPNYYDFIPAIWLSVLYDRIGNREKALSYHEKAKELKPHHPSVKSNDIYFKKSNQNKA